jgi:hypothetical protein
VVIGGFVAHVSTPALAAAVRVFTGEQLLRIGFVLDDKDRLDDVSQLVTDVQIDATLSAASTHGLWTELDDLLAHLTADRAGRMRDRFSKAPAELVAAVREAAASGALSQDSLAKLTA